MVTEYILIRVEAMKALWRYSFPGGGGGGEGFVVTEYILFRVEAVKAFWRQSIFFSGWRR